MGAIRKETTELRLANIAFHGLRSYNEGVKYRIREVLMGCRLSYQHRLMEAIANDGRYPSYGS